jgi:hypothetical protein
LNSPAKGFANSKAAGLASYEVGMFMARDIDYAAVAVKKAIVEKFWQTNLQDFEAVAGEKTISLRHDGRVAEGSRDNLLAAVRKSASFDQLWEVLENEGRRVD